jgi:hypothetical protein
MGSMKFVKAIRLGPPDHELRIFLCPHCGEVETKEVIGSSKVAYVR